MQLSRMIYVLFSSIAIAVPTTSSSRKPTSTPAAKTAVPRKLTPATPPTMADVRASIANWDTSVNTVNAYLNDPQNKTKLTNAIAFAKDEPVQLATLMKVTNLPATGVNAGKVLMGNFPSIVSNLDSVNTGVMATQDATTAVNFNRCCTVLPNIGLLWQAASVAMNAGNVSIPNLENQCSLMDCASGASSDPATVIVANTST